MASSVTSSDPALHASVSVVSSVVQGQSWGPHARAEAPPAPLGCLSELRGTSCCLVFLCDEMYLSEPAPKPHVCVSFLPRLLQCNWWGATGPNTGGGNGAECECGVG